MSGNLSDLSIRNLHRGYREDDFKPTDVVDRVIERAHNDDNNAWISLVEKGEVRERAAELTAELSSDISLANKPLFGIPFGVKDNIDCKGEPTTAACPTYEYTADKNAPAVAKILDAGGILIGKTNMDQFATGVVGTRSPYGVCKNAIDNRYISGGSSSGSAVTVATNQVTFALGTDTGGSGRVPAACNGVIGLKPSRGVITKAGVVPACKSLDCVSVFATSCLDALLVENVAAGFDSDDEYSDRSAGDVSLTPPTIGPSTVIGVPETGQLEFYSDHQQKALYSRYIDDLKRTKFETEEYDIAPFLECSSLLFKGPWIVERRQAIKCRVADYPADLLEVIQEVLSAADDFSAEDVFAALHRREKLRQETAGVFESVDCILVPTIGTLYTIDEVQEAPLTTNSHLGLYTNFVNLLDLCAITVPAGRRRSGLPFSITLVGPKHKESKLASIADEMCTTNDEIIGTGLDYVSLDSPWENHDVTG